MKRIWYKDESYIDVEDNSAWEYENDPDYLTTSSPEKFSHVVSWNHGSSMVMVYEYDTKEEAVKAAWDMAKKAGYTPPKWYQFWRWFEQREPRK